MSTHEKCDTSLAENKHEIADSEIILLCRKGDAEAYGKIVLKYQKAIFNIVYRMLLDTDDAADITQSAFIKAYENLDRYKTEYPFYSWLHKIAVNEALNFIKQRQRLVGLDDKHESDYEDPESEYSRNELQHRIDRAIAKLSPENGIIIILRHFGELSYREISEILDIPEKTVKSRLFSSRQALRGFLE
jgi:RNA polymerase sigma-70 factor, ECF subfamily